MSEPLLEVSQVGKTFTTPQGPLTILHDITFRVWSGERVAIIGPSGSGKSTLLSLLGLLDVPTTGTIKIAGVAVNTLTEAAQAKFRNEKIGFIFQSFELINPFTVRENINTPVELAGRQPNESMVQGLLDTLSLSHRTEAMPETLSGGEKQRVAIGRALVHEPALLLADEPTGSLDRATGERVLSLLLEQVSRRKSTLLIITHDQSIAARMDRVFTMVDGTIHEER